MDDKFNYELSLVVNTHRAFEEMYNYYARVRAIMSQPISVPVKTDPDFEKAIKEAERLKQEIQKVEGQISDAEVEARQLASRGQESLKKLEQAARGMGSQLGKALEKGTKEAQTVLDDLVKQLESTASGGQYIEAAKTALHSRYRKRHKELEGRRKALKAEATEAYYMGEQGDEEARERSDQLIHELAAVREEIEAIERVLEAGKGASKGEQAKARERITDEHSRLQKEKESLRKQLSEYEGMEEGAPKELAESYQALLERTKLLDQIVKVLSGDIHEGATLLAQLEREYATDTGVTPETIRELGTSAISAFKGVRERRAKAESLTEGIAPSIKEYESLIDAIIARVQSMELDPTGGVAGDPPRKGEVAEIPTSLSQEDIRKQIEAALQDGSFRLPLDGDTLRKDVQNALDKASYSLKLEIGDIGELVDAALKDVALNIPLDTEQLRSGVKGAIGDAPYPIKLEVEGGREGIESLLQEKPFEITLDSKGVQEQIEESLKGTTYGVKLELLGAETIVERLEEMARGDGGEGGLTTLPIDLELNKERFIQSIRDALDAVRDDPSMTLSLVPEFKIPEGGSETEIPGINLPDYPLGIDADHFVHSLKEALKRADEELNIVVSPSLDPLVEEMKELLGEARTQSTRELQNRIERRDARRAVRQLVREDKLPALLSKYVPEGLPYLREIQTAYHPGMPKEEIPYLHQAAISLERAIFERVRQLPPKPSVERTILETLYDAVGASYTTDIRSRMRDFTQSEITQTQVQEEREAKKQARIAEKEERLAIQELGRELATQIRSGEADQVFERYFPQGKELAERILAGLAEGASLSVIDRAMEATHELDKALNEAIQSLPVTDHPTRERMALETIRGTFRATASGVLQRREIARRTRSLTQAERLAEREEWDRQAGALRAEIEAFTLYRPDFSVARPFKQAQEIYRRYAQARQRYEAESDAFYEADTMEEREAAIRRLRAAAEALKRTDRAYKSAALSVSDREISIPLIQFHGDELTVDPSQQVTVPLSSAHMTLEAAFRREFGDAYRQYHASALDGDRPPADFGEFLSGVMRGEDRYLQFYARIKGESDQVLKNEEQRRRFLSQHIAPLQQGHKILQETNRELERQQRHSQALERYSIMRQAREQQLGPYRQAIRSAAYVLGGSAIGLGAAWQVRSAMQTYIQLEQEIAGIRGVLVGRSEYDAAQIRRGVVGVAQRYGGDLLETARAARVLAQSGLEAEEVIRELDNTMMAMRGLGITVEQAQELQIAIRAITDESERAVASQHVFDRISAIESRYAVNAMDIADAIRSLSPVMKQYENNIAGIEDAVDYTSAVTTVMVEQLRITGMEASNAFRFMLSRLARPEILKRLQETFGLQVATPDGGDFLALPDLLGEIARKYQELSSDDATRAQAKMFAVQLAGGRQVNRIIPVLENYSRVQQIATQSSMAFGDAQDRADITLDTLGVRLERLQANFRLFIDNMLESSSVADALRGSVGLLADVFGGMSGRGGGPLTAAMLALGIGAAGRGVGAMYRLASTATMMGSDTPAVIAAQRAQAREQALALAQRYGTAGARGGGVAAVLGMGARVVGAGGMIASAAILAVTGLVGLTRAFEKTSEEADKFRATIKDLDELRIWESPQVQSMDRRAREYGLGRAHGVYQALRRYGLESGGPNIQRMLERYEVDTWTALLERDDAPRALRDFRREFTAAFVDDLGDAGNVLRELRPGEQIKVIGEMIGDTFYAMTYQVNQAMDALQASYTRISEHAKEALQSSDRFEARGILQKLRAAYTSAMGRGLQSAITFEFTRRGADRYLELREEGYTRDEAERLSILESAQDHVSDLLANILPRGMHEAATATEEFAEVIEEFHQRAGEGRSTFVDIMDAWMDRIEGTDTRRNVIEALAARMLDIAGQPELAEALYPSITEFERADQDTLEATTERVRSRLEAMVAEASDLAAQMTYDHLMDTDEARREIDALHKLFQRAVSNAMFALDGMTGELFRFQDRLLDIVFKISERFHRMQAEEEFARRYGFTFDRGDSFTSIGREIHEQVSMFPVMQDMEIAKLAEELRRLNVLQEEMAGEAVLQSAAIERAVAGIGDEEFTQVVDNIATRSRRLARQLDALREGAIRAQELRAGGLKDLWPTGEGQAEGTRILNQLQEIFSGTQIVAEFRDRLRAQYQTDDISKIFEELDREYKSTYDTEGSISALEMLREQVVSFFTTLGQYHTVLDQTLAQTFDTRIGELEQEAEFREAQLPLMATLIDQYKVQEEIEDRRHRLEMERLDTLREYNQLSLTDYILEKHKLEQERERDKLHRERMLRVRAVRDLEEQALDTLQGGIAGLRAVLTDLDIFGAILDAEDAEERSEAVRGAILTAFSPLADALHSRVVDNLLDSLTEALSENEAVMGIFGTAEYRLRENIEMAHATGGHTVAQAILEAHRQGATTLSATIAGKRITVPIPGGFDEDPGPDPQEGVTGSNWAANLGMLAGPFLGMMVNRNINSGRVGPYASITSSIGSTAGAAIGHMLLPGVGGMVGGLLGGLLGGFLGGTGKEDRDVTVSVLESIESAQRETITAIENQTDTLLRLDSRFLYVPSTLTVPDYGGFSVWADRLPPALPVPPTSTGPAVHDNRTYPTTVNVTVPIHTTTEVDARVIEAQIGRAVEDSVTRAIRRERRDRRRG